jgi:DNA-binding IclR family transcriptional regulator
MVSLGYIRQIKKTKRYRIGRPLFALAAGALDEMEMVSMATPVLHQLSFDTGESSHFAVSMNNSVIVLARTDGLSAFQLTERIGIVRPAYCTALGKIVLAALRPDQFDRYLERTRLKPLTEWTITDPAVLRREIEDVGRAEIAFDDGEFDPEVRCAAIAVRDFTGRTDGAIGISGPSGACRSTACEAARAISRMRPNVCQLPSAPADMKQDKPDRSAAGVIAGQDSAGLAAERSRETACPSRMTARQIGAERRQRAPGAASWLRGGIFALPTAPRTSARALLSPCRPLHDLRSNRLSAGFGGKPAQPGTSTRLAKWRST